MATLHMERAAEREQRLAALPAHEAVAVLGRLHDKLLDDAQDLAQRVEDFHGMVYAVLVAVGKEHVAKAGQTFELDDHPDNVAYLDGLVERVMA